MHRRARLFSIEIIYGFDFKKHYMKHINNFEIYNLFIHCFALQPANLLRNCVSRLICFCGDALVSVFP